MPIINRAIAVALVSAVSFHQTAFQPNLFPSFNFRFTCKLLDQALAEVSSSRLSLPPDKGVKYYRVQSREQRHRQANVLRLTRIVATSCATR